MTCAMCHRAGGRPLVLVSGQNLGDAHDGECCGLLWERHFLEATNASPYDKALLSWQWRRRLAALDGRTFLEAAPKSPAEMTLDRLIATHGWTSVAKELS